MSALTNGKKNFHSLHLFSLFSPSNFYLHKSLFLLLLILLQQNPKVGERQFIYTAYNFQGIQQHKINLPTATTIKTTTFKKPPCGNLMGYLRAGLITQTLKETRILRRNKWGIDRRSARNVTTEEAASVRWLKSAQGKMRQNSIS